MEKNGQISRLGLFFESSHQNGFITWNESMAIKQEPVKFVLRIPPSLHRRVKAAAKRNRTSMNKEIVNRLSSSIEGRDADALLKDLITALETKRVIDPIKR